MEHVIYDTETTGLVNRATRDLTKQPHVIEFAGIRINSKGKVLRKLEFFCNPGVKLDDEIRSITNITQEQVDGAKPFKEHFDQLATLFKKADNAIAHNMAFDKQLMDFEFKRNNLTWVWPSQMTCTVEATEFIKGRRMKLKELHEYLFEEGFEGAHRAMTDVLALTRCVVELGKRGIIEL